MPPTLMYLSEIPQSESQLCFGYQRASSVCLQNDIWEHNSFPDESLKRFQSFWGEMNLLCA